MATTVSKKRLPFLVIFLKEPPLFPGGGNSSEWTNDLLGRMLVVSLDSGLSCAHGKNNGSSADHSIAACPL